MNGIERYLGKYLLYEEQPAKVVGVATDDMILVEMVENLKCPHCGGDLGKNQFWINPISPLFKEKAKPIETIENP